MDQHALLMYTLMRQPTFDSPEIARRREHLLWLERQTREARTRPRRERVRRARSLIAWRRTGRDDWMRRIEAPDLRQVLR